MLIAIEGIDRAGKTTLAERLRVYYESKNTAVTVLHSPMANTGTGRLIETIKKL